MDKIARYIQYELKIFLGNLSSAFWMIAFPLLLLTVFTFAFSNLRFKEFELEKIKMMYHEDAFIPLSLMEMSEDENIQNIYNKDKSKIENSLFSGKLMDKSTAIKSLEAKEIDAYVDEDLTLIVNNGGIQQSIMDEMITMYKQIEKSDLPYDAYEFDRTYAENIERKYSSLDVVFYSLFSMMTLYGAYLSSSIGNRVIARVQKVSLRNITSATPMSTQVMISVLACLLWSLLTVIIMVLYSEFVLRQDFFRPDIHNFYLILPAIIFGTSWGLFLGTVIEKPSLQLAAVISSLLIMSAFSGLYSDGLRTMIQRIFPAIHKINPVSMIGNELIKINMLTNYSSLLNTVAVLMGYSTLLIIISTVYIRRKKA